VRFFSEARIEHVEQHPQISCGWLGILRNVRALVRANT
jgi:hypothetical protein